MDEIAVYKALSNETRLHIVKWLKNPVKHFVGWQKSDAHLGVCCGLIQKKTGLSQSTISSYLSLLEKSQLLTATRAKQWTYYKRNEVFIQQFCKHLKAEL